MLLNKIIQLPKKKIHILQKVTNKTRLLFVICEFIISLRKILLHTVYDKKSY